MVSHLPADFDAAAHAAALKKFARAYTREGLRVTLTNLGDLQRGWKEPAYPVEGDDTEWHRNRGTNDLEQVEAGIDARGGIVNLGILPGDRAAIADVDGDQGEAWAAYADQEVIEAWESTPGTVDRTVDGEVHKGHSRGVHVLLKYGDDVAEALDELGVKNIFLPNGVNDAGDILLKVRGTTYVVAAPSYRPDGAYDDGYYKADGEVELSEGGRTATLGLVTPMPQKVKDHIFQLLEDKREREAKRAADKAARAERLEQAKARRDAGEDLPLTYEELQEQAEEALREWERNTSWELIVTERLPSYGHQAWTLVDANGTEEKWADPYPHSMAGHNAVLNEEPGDDGLYWGHYWSAQMPEYLEFCKDYGNNFHKMQLLAYACFDGNFREAHEAEGLPFVEDLKGVVGPQMVDRIIGEILTTPKPVTAAAPTVGQVSSIQPMQATQPQAAVATLQQPQGGARGFGQVSESMQTVSFGQEAVEEPVEAEQPTNPAAAFIAFQERTEQPLSPEKEAEAVRMERYLERQLRFPTVAEQRAGVERHDYEVSEETKRRIRLALRNDAVVGSAPPAPGEEANDISRMFPKGTTYDPWLIRQIFDINDVTRAIFHAAEDFERPVSPVSVLMETIMAVSRRTPMMVSTSTGKGWSPHSIFTIHGGRSGSGKSNSQDVHPWYGVYQTIELDGGAKRTRCDFVYPKKQDGEDDKAWKERCAEARHAYEVAMEEDEKQNGPWEDRTEYPASPQALAQMLTYVEIDEFGNKVSKVHEQAVVPIYKDEMSAMLGKDNKAGGNNLVGWTAAFSSKDPSGTAVTTGSRSANGRFTVTVSAGLQARLAGGILAHKSLGATQRFFFTDAVYPLKGLLGDVIPRPDGIVKVLLPWWRRTAGEAMGLSTVHYQWDKEVLDDIALEGSLGSQVMVTQDGINASQSLTVRIRIACCAAQLFGSVMYPITGEGGVEYRPQTARVTKEIWDWTGYLMEYHRRGLGMMEAEAEAAEADDSAADGKKLGIKAATAKLTERKEIAEVGDAAREMWGRITQRYKAGDVVTQSRLNKNGTLKWQRAIDELLQQGLLASAPVGRGGGIRYKVVRTN
ncbi:bifunctional DNA primase/polymerase [Corynebacterium amycolatum]|uniref:bifunctional DNA primase/polymerase n=1 Tax=Corynebacterium amycolatum TaxID=43765 RepID=UPI00223B219E|nr:bifunctional DNA primase/polymerase [Corynebacterium amycolatum]MCT1719629.1 hypothetical protein [Corynebacterium amycolatum]